MSRSARGACLTQVSTRDALGGQKDRAPYR